ncbi:Hypothetical_protein [Hexamita inflata]|uniref:Hypothetical_protein n=1 Tax=Hexamita inflata TaxID=28002 RepID=A0AA86RPQ9_9EUKA|nr:Hypothetical protein HINF_LOCUS65033 [Hexamita inflata]
MLQSQKGQISEKDNVREIYKSIQSCQSSLTSLFQSQQSPLPQNRQKQNFCEFCNSTLSSCHENNEREQLQLSQYVYNNNISQLEQEIETIGNVLKYGNIVGNSGIYQYNLQEPQSKTYQTQTTQTETANQFLQSQLSNSYSKNNVQQNINKGKYEHQMRLQQLQKERQQVESLLLSPQFFQKENQLIDEQLLQSINESMEKTKFTSSFKTKGQVIFGEQEVKHSVYIVDFDTHLFIYRKWSINNMQIPQNIRIQLQQFDMVKPQKCKQVIFKAPQKQKTIFVKQIAENQGEIKLYQDINKLKLFQAENEQVSNIKFDICLNQTISNEQIPRTISQQLPITQKDSNINSTKKQTNINYTTYSKLQEKINITQFDQQQQKLHQKVKISEESPNQTQQVFEPFFTNIQMQQPLQQDSHQQMKTQLFQIKITDQQHQFPKNTKTNIFPTLVHHSFPPIIQCSEPTTQKFAVQSEQIEQTNYINIQSENQTEQMSPKLNKQKSLHKRSEIVCISPRKQIDMDLIQLLNQIENDLIKTNEQEKRANIVQTETLQYNHHLSDLEIQTNYNSNTVFETPKLQQQVLSIVSPNNVYIQPAKTVQSEIDLIMTKIDPQYEKQYLVKLYEHLKMLTSKSLEEFVFGRNKRDFTLFEAFQNEIQHLYNSNNEMKLMRVYLKLVNKSNGILKNSLLDQVIYLYQ